MTRFFMVLVLSMAPLLAVCAKPVAGADEPLLIEGKRELYQRVLAVPGARMATEAGGQGREAVTPFTAFYVYSRRMLDGAYWGKEIPRAAKMPGRLPSSRRMIIWYSMITP